MSELTALVKTVRGYAGDRDWACPTRTLEAAADAMEAQEAAIVKLVLALEKISGNTEDHNGPTRLCFLFQHIADEALDEYKALNPSIQKPTIE